MAAPESFVLFSHYTAFVIVSGLAAWLGGVAAGRIARKENRRIQEELAAIKSELKKSNQLLDAELQTDLTVHSIQFRKEFDIYLRLSKAMSNVRRELFTLQPNIRALYHDPETGEARQKELKSSFIDAWSHFRDILQDYRPFYHDSVYEAADAIVELTMEEVARIKMPLYEDATAYDDIRNMKDDLLKAIDVAQNAIKQRISTVRIKTG